MGGELRFWGVTGGWVTADSAECAALQDSGAPAGWISLMGRYSGQIGVAKM